ncbi:MAG: hypothetical protein HUU29_00305 [Planctomycetaceae bacterium]|nr:hypothetical protein [Planctomycetaceae bacterium]
MKTLLGTAVLCLAVGSTAYYCGYQHADEALQASAESSKSGPAVQDDGAFLGISYQKSYFADEYEVTYVHVGSPAWRAGLVKGDAITGVKATVDGKEQDKPVSPAFLFAGLRLGEPGDSYTFNVKRGAASLDLEKRVLVDWAREKLDVPCAKAFFDNVRVAMKDFKQSPTVWLTVTAASRNEFDAVFAKEQSKELAKLELQKVNAEIRKLEAEAVALEKAGKLAEAQKLDAQVSMFESIIGLLFSLNGV